jgi:hypothetical protein
MNANNLKSRIRHDCKAQIINLRGFCSEIERAISRFEAQNTSNHEKIAGLDSLINKDVLPCLSYVKHATDQLDQLLDSLPKDSDSGNEELVSEQPA